MCCLAPPDMFRTATHVSLALGLTAILNAQGPGDFPALTNAPTPGAPVLGQPTLIMGATKPVMGEQHGLAAPAVYDWNGDGKKDLLIGEFETTECWVRVYLNEGTDTAPKFSDKFIYATTSDGARMQIDSW